MTSDDPGLKGRDLLTAIVDMHERDNRPVKWISRSTGVDARGINWVLKVAGFRSHDVHDLAKYDRMEYLVQDGVSHSEIVRTLKCDRKTIERWFPGSAWTAGGWAEYGGLIRELNRQRSEFERHGKIGRNRDAGFALRRDME